MITKEQISKIIEAGVKAPSGSNSQPWRFRVRDNIIDTFALPEKDHPVLNVRRRGTLVAHGALIENMRIAAHAFGVDATVGYFPNPRDPCHTATIVLETEVSPSDQALYQAISQRATSRKPYKPTPLSTQERERLNTCAAAWQDAQVRFVDDQDIMGALAKDLSLAEAVIFGNHSLHRLMFEELVWSETAERMRRSGLYVKTLELARPQELVLHLCRFWPVMRFLNALGFACMVARANAEIYKSSAAIGVVIVDDRDEAFITAGEVMERLWLEATALGLHMQLITGVLFFAQAVRSGNHTIFSPNEEHRITEAYHRIASILDVPESKVIALAFRMGKSEAPSARSSRMPPVIEFTRLEAECHVASHQDECRSDLTNMGVNVLCGLLTGFAEMPTQL